MNELKYTIKQLLKDKSAPTFHQAFGVDEKRGVELVRAIEKIMNDIMVDHTGSKTWSPAKMVDALADADLAQTVPEVAVAMYLVGCRIGERTAIQGLIQNSAAMREHLEEMLKDVQLDNSIMRRREGRETIN